MIFLEIYMFLHSIILCMYGSIYYTRPFSIAKPTSFSMLYYGILTCSCFLVNFMNLYEVMNWFSHHLVTLTLKKKSTSLTLNIAIN